ncbi:MAG: glycosyltransferase, partial [Candidatus Omnitrophica bacterium]|nr:glycosyltransferase [Candidatus Omnitrophota bacterium]
MLELLLEVEKIERLRKTDPTRAKELLQQFIANYPADLAFGFYSLSKIIPEEDILSLKPGKGFVLRFTNGYGPRMRPDVLQIFMSRLSQGQPVGYSGHVRDFVEVRDSAEAIRRVADGIRNGKLKTNELIHVASGAEPHSMQSALGKVANALGVDLANYPAGIKPIEDLPDLVLPRMSLDKLQRVLNFRPQIPIETGLRRLVRQRSETRKPVGSWQEAGSRPQAFSVERTADSQKQFQEALDANRYSLSAGVTRSESREVLSIVIDDIEMKLLAVDEDLLESLANSGERDRGRYLQELLQAIYPDDGSWPHIASYLESFELAKLMALAKLVLAVQKLKEGSAQAYPTLIKINEILGRYPVLITGTEFEKAVMQILRELSAAGDIRYVLKEDRIAGEFDGTEKAFCNMYDSLTKAAGFAPGFVGPHPERGKMARRRLLEINRRLRRLLNGNLDFGEDRSEVIEIGGDISLKQALYDYILLIQMFPSISGWGQPGRENDASGSDVHKTVNAMNKIILLYPGFLNEYTLPDISVALTNSPYRVAEQSIELRSEIRLPDGMELSTPLQQDKLFQYNFRQNMKAGNYRSFRYEDLENIVRSTREMERRVSGYFGVPVSFSAIRLWDETDFPLLDDYRDPWLASVDTISGVQGRYYLNLNMGAPRASLRLKEDIRVIALHELLHATINEACPEAFEKAERDDYELYLRFWKGFVIPRLNPIRFRANSPEIKSAERDSDELSHLVVALHEIIVWRVTQLILEDRSFQDLNTVMMNALSANGGSEDRISEKASIYRDLALLVAFEEITGKPAAQTYPKRWARVTSHWSAEKIQAVGDDFRTFFNSITMPIDGRGTSELLATERAISGATEAKQPESSVKLVADREEQAQQTLSAGFNRSEVRRKATSHQIRDQDSTSLSQYVSPPLIKSAYSGELPVFELLETRRKIVAGYNRYVRALSQAGRFDPVERLLSRDRASESEIFAAVERSGFFGPPEDYDWRDLAVHKGEAWAISEPGLVYANFKHHQRAMVQMALDYSKRKFRLLVDRFQGREINRFAIEKLLRRAYQTMYAPLTARQKNLLALAVTPAHDLGRIVTGENLHSEYGGDLIRTFTEDLALSREEKALIKLLTESDTEYGALAFGVMPFQTLIRKLRRRQIDPDTYFAMMGLLYLFDAGSVPRGSLRQMGRLTPVHVTNAMLLTQAESRARLLRDFHLKRWESCFLPRNGKELEALDFSKAPGEDERIKMPESFRRFAETHRAFTNHVALRRSAYFFIRMAEENPDNLLKLLFLLAGLYEQSARQEKMSTIHFSQDLWETPEGEPVCKKIPETLEKLNLADFEAGHIYLELDRNQSRLLLKKRGAKSALAEVQVAKFGRHTLEIFVESWREHAGLKSSVPQSEPTTSRSEIRLTDGQEGRYPQSSRSETRVEPLLAGKTMVVYADGLFFISGMRTHLKNLMPALAAANPGLTIHVIVLTGNSNQAPLSGQEFENGSKIIYHLLDTKTLDPEHPLVPSQMVEQELEQIHSGSPIDLIVGQTPFHLPALRVNLFARKHRIPVIQQFRGGPWELLGKKFKTGSEKLLPHTVKILRTADLALGSSRFAANKLMTDFEELGLCKVEYLYPMIDADFWDRTQVSDAEITAIEEEYDLDNQFVVLMVGRVNQGKGFHYALQAAKRLKTRAGDKGITIVLVGPYDSPAAEKYARQLKELVADTTPGTPVRLILMGGLSHEEIRKWYAISDVTVLTSILPDGTSKDVETFGQVPVEAQLMGVPVIVSDVGGLPETLEAGHTGFVVAQANAAAILEPLQQLYDRPELRQEMGQQAAVATRQRFDKTEILRQHIELFARLMRKYPRPDRRLGHGYHEWLLTEKSPGDFNEIRGYMKGLPGQVTTAEGGLFDFGDERITLQRVGDDTLRVTDEKTRDQWETSSQVILDFIFQPLQEDNPGGLTVRITADGYSQTITLTDRRMLRSLFIQDGIFFFHFNVADETSKQEYRALLKAWDAVSRNVSGDSLGFERIRFLSRSANYYSVGVRSTQDDDDGERSLLREAAEKLREAKKDFYWACGLLMGGTLLNMALQPPLIIRLILMVPITCLTMAFGYRLGAKIEKLHDAREAAKPREVPEEQPPTDNAKSTDENAARSEVRRRELPMRDHLIDVVALYELDLLRKPEDRSSYEKKA